MFCRDDRSFIQKKRRQKSPLPRIGFTINKTLKTDSGCAYTYI